MRKPSHIALFSICLALAFTSLCTAQDRIRTLDETDPRYNFPNPPIAIVSREVPSKSFMNDGKVLAGSDWLKDLTLNVKNISQKPIVNFQILLTIPKQGKMPFDAGMMLTFPQPERVLNGAGKPTGDYKPLAVSVLQPGAIIKVQVWQHQLQILEDIKKQDVPDVDFVSVSIRHVVFDDGTGWFVGKETREDRDNPKGQIFVRPDKPEQPYREWFSKWLRSSTLMSAIVQPISRCDRGLPASSRFFFASANFISLRPAPAPAPAPTPGANGCGYSLGRIPESCNSRGCSATGVCWWPNDRVYPDDQGFMTNFGRVSLSTGYWCEPDFQQTPPPSGGACLASTGCQSFQIEVFYPDSTCGQPQGCGNTAQWGCVSPLFDVNGICQRSVDYQNGCSGGYNSLACACYPPPPPPGGCNGLPYANGSCASGFVVNGGVCMRSSGFINQCFQNGGDYEDFSCSCTGCFNCGESPILIDTAGNGFDLSNAANGVQFDLNADGTPEHRGWTLVGTDDAWLVLDRDGNGTIDDGKEMFGDVTSQEPPPAGVERNGFRALAMYDGPGYGGNSDGKINHRDVIFSMLRMWKDTNHNGVSESGELHTLPDVGLRTLDLDYRESRRTDEHGNRFRFRAKVLDVHGAQLGRWAWDVYLVTSP